jgi:hypothetical protein
MKECSNQSFVFLSVFPSKESPFHRFAPPEQAMNAVVYTCSCLYMHISTIAIALFSVDKCLLHLWDPG